MKSDINGVSTCPIGEEQWEEYKSALSNNEIRIQYDYRALNGKLFGCITKTLEEARMKRDAWLKEHNWQA